MTPTLHQATRASALAESADRIRHHILDMGEVQGQGYVGQALGFADVLAVVYKDLARLRPEDPEWEDRDRVLLSMGHYAIAVYAALAEAGTLDVAELETYGSDDSRLPHIRDEQLHLRDGDLRRLARPRAGTRRGDGARTPSPGQGRAGDQPDVRRRAGRGLHLGGGHGGLSPPSGPTALRGRHERAAGRRADQGRAAHRAGGGQVGRIRLARVRCDGNDIPALLEAFDSVPAEDDRPAVVVCNTQVGRGVPFLEAREKAHFIRIDEHQWELAREALRHTATEERN